MRITFLGQAGMHIETRKGSILCDPWFNPAFFASWFPFPSNEDIDVSAIGSPTYLYVSHLHRDHFDETFLHDHVSKDAIVVLPDYPLDKLERELHRLGFTRLLRTKHGRTLDLDGLRLTVFSYVTPADGPTGDSALLVDDGEVRIFHQNDARPADLDELVTHGPFDAHFLQFSGANWYPMAYRWPERAKRGLARRKRENDLARALRYVRALGARFVFPSAGPPCFLDDELFHLNDFDHDLHNIFPDQSVFVDYLRANGHANGRLLLPGSVAEIDRELCKVSHPVSDDEVRAIFTRKRDYLEAYRERQRLRLQTIKRGWPHAQVDILDGLRQWFEPLLALADRISAGVGGRVLLDCGRERVVVDFVERRVYAWQGEQCRYRFWFAPELVEACILRHEEDWENELLLSCRFQAERDGPYNEYVYHFFKALSLERLQYVEGFYAEQEPVRELWECDGYLVQRRCPHMKSDLARFGQVEDGILTCTVHGWQFELATGRCLTSDDRTLYRVPVGQADSEVPGTAST